MKRREFMHKCFQVAVGVAGASLLLAKNKPKANDFEIENLTVFDHISSPYEIGAITLSGLGKETGWHFVAVNFDGKGHAVAYYLDGEKQDIKAIEPVEFTQNNRGHSMCFWIRNA